MLPGSDDRSAERSQTKHINSIPSVYQSWWGRVTRLDILPITEPGYMLETGDQLSQLADRTAEDAPLESVHSNLLDWNSDQIN